jgi:hypothetical protein
MRFILTGGGPENGHSYDGDDDLKEFVCIDEAPEIVGAVKGYCYKRTQDVSEEGFVVFRLHKITPPKVWDT